MFEHQKEMFGDTAAEFSAMMERMYDGLGMTALESLQGGLNIDDGFSILDVTLAYKQRKGILEMLAFQNDFVLRRSFIPKDAQTASISAFSIEETFAAVETTMDAIMPGMFKLAVMGQIGLYESTSKHSFQRDILGNLASEVVTVSASERPDDMVVLVKLNDQAAFKEAFGFLAGFLAGMRQQEGEAIDLHGLKARQFRLPASGLNPNPSTMAYAYTRGYLVLSFGKHETLGKVVAGFKNPKDALWKQPLVQQAVRKLETDYVHLSYVSIPPVLASYLGQLAPFISRSVDDLPSLDHWETLIGDAVFSLHLEKNRFVGRAVLLPGSE